MKLVFDSSFNRVTSLFDASELTFMPNADGTFSAILNEDNGRFIAITESDLQPTDRNLSAVHTLETGETVQISHQGPPVVVPVVAEAPVEEVASEVVAETPAEPISGEAPTEDAPAEQPIEEAPAQ